MAYQITGPGFGHFISPKDMTKTVADQTGNASFAVLARGARYAIVRIYLKVFAAGTATIPTQFIVEAASDSGFTTDVVSAGMQPIDLTDEGAALVLCFSPLKALKWWRIRPVFSGTASGTFDAELMGS